MGIFIFVNEFFANYRYIRTTFSYISDFSVPCRNTIWPARSSIAWQTPYVFPVMTTSTPKSLADF